MKRIRNVIRVAFIRLVRSPLLQRILQLFVNTLARCITIDKDMVLCGSMNGKLYGDNSRYIYEWLLDQGVSAHPVWITRSKKVYQDLKQQGKPVVMSNRPAGWLCLMKGHVGVFTNSLYDLAMLPGLIPTRISLIALRHGRSVKRVRFARKQHTIDELERQERIFESRLIQYVISTSEMISDMQEECLKVGREKHVVTGYPRNDFLQRPAAEDIQNWNNFIGKEAGNRKTVLYAPSWRHGREATRFFPFNDFNESKLIEFLKKMNIQLILRPHMNDLFKYPDLVEFLSGLCDRSDNVRLASHTIFPDVNSILPFADILISDYSALYHDYLLLDKPMLFVPYDYEDFLKNNGFLYDYLELLPGPSLSTMSDFFVSVTSLIEGNDTFKEQRDRLKGMIHQYDDACSTKRVYELIKQTKEIC